MISRSELAELFREDDRHRAEWQAERDAQASPYVQRNDDAAGLLFRTIDNAPVPVPTPEPDAVYSRDSEPEGFTEYQSDVLAGVIAELREEWRRDHAVEIAELRGQISALLTMLGQKSFKADFPGEIVDLPNWRKRRDVA